MVNQQLLDYIKQQLQRGVSKEEIKNSLLANGWEEKDIEEAFYLVSSSSSQVQPQPNFQQTNLSLPTATAIFGQAWSIYKRRFGTFLGVMIIPTLISIGLTIVLLVISSSFLSSEFSVGNIGLRILLAILFLSFIFISEAWGQTALLYAIKDSQEGISVVESYRRGWHKILSYLWVSLLVGFITLGGFLLLIVPGFIFAVWFSLAVFVLVAEDLKGMNALLKSKEYVRGKWSSVFWRLLFVSGIFSILSFVLILIFGLLKIPFGKEISHFIINLFLVPLMVTYLFLVYSNLKALKNELVFTPTRGEKLGFIFVAILGFLIIPGVLSSVTFSKLGSARKKARDIQRESSLRQIQTELEMYYEEYGRYPSSLEELSRYLGDASIIPVDPKTNRPYQYQVQSGGEDYKICAEMEEGPRKCLTSPR